jgi:hypothetical protein
MYQTSPGKLRGPYLQKEPVPSSSPSCNLSYQTGKHPLMRLAPGLISKKGNFRDISWTEGLSSPLRPTGQMSRPVFMKPPGDGEPGRKKMVSRENTAVCPRLYRSRVFPVVPLEAFLRGSDA